MLRTSLLRACRQVRQPPALHFSWRRCESTLGVYNSSDEPPAGLVPRERPLSPTYFTGNPAYNDLIVGLDALMQQYVRRLNHPALSSTQETSQLMLEIEKLKRLGFGIKDASPEVRKQFTRPFLSMEDMSEKLNVQLKEGQYYAILNRLHWLTCLTPMPDEARVYLRVFMARSLNKAATQEKQPVLDDLGRAYAVGRRKEANARVWLVEGEGHIYINGKPLAEYFINYEPREAVIYPLQVVNGLGKYNVWAMVRGSGTTGQSGALALGIAKALVHHNPQFQEGLAQLGLLRRDPRMVERKKTGQPKARKKYTWVKR
ncbi:37S ribosomal protein S9, mitochondrial [Dimargaris verticillata]|uniref:Small ribosomal subunit protein uS9m n=1 Tax=Dimargaris verticillata TaxID=2761393 RepID=A0A9W8E9H6_9FUNG|nr:37S ribosomal protein S9, mitochondrial [Dimargaris verticillata]